MPTDAADRNENPPELPEPRHTVRPAVLLTAAGLIVSGLIGFAFYAALPDTVHSTSASAPRGATENKTAALGFLLWLIPDIAIFLVGGTVAITAMGPECLNVRSPEAKAFWTRPGNWPTARAFILRTTALFTAGLCVLVVADVCLVAGEQAWSLNGVWWVGRVTGLIVLLAWLVRTLMRLERPESFAR